MSAIYHILDKIPAIYKFEIQEEYESLAQELIKSGRLRIDTDYQCNFARFSDPRANVNMMISLEEITNPLLIQKTEARLRKLYIKKTNSEFQDIVKAIKQDLQNQLKKLQPIPSEVVIKLARIFVQSAHPIVIKWLLHDEVEVFITYSHNIGDMMDMQSWQRSGTNSGMQSTDGKNAAIFVSCGGDPFVENNQLNPTVGNGWAAIARMQIIAAQELGHFADIQRDSLGRQISRHSANFNGTKATAHTIAARKQDIQTCNLLLKTLHENYLKIILKYENEFKFYKVNKIFGLKILLLKLKLKIYRHKILNFAHHNELFFVKKFAHDQYIGLMLQAMIKDMLVNISPVADVYKRDDADAQEAIVCIEALARVPQQVMKWGYLTTSQTMKELYKIYYGEVITSLITNYSSMTNTQFRRLHNHNKNSLFQRFKKFFDSRSNTKLKMVREL